MHELVCAGDGINRTRCPTMCATDTERFIDNGDLDNGGRFDQWLGISAKKPGQARDRDVTTRRTQVDRSAAVNDGLRVGAATGVTTLRTLSLWQQCVDLVNDLSGIAWHLPRGKTQHESRGKRDCRDDRNGSQDCRQHRFQSRAMPENPMKARDMMPAVISAIAVPLNGRGISAACRRSRMAAKSTRTRAKPPAAPNP